MENEIHADHGKLYAALESAGIAPRSIVVAGNGRETEYEARKERMSTDKNTFEVTGTFERSETFTTKGGKSILTIILKRDGDYPQVIPIKVFGRLCETARGLKPGQEVEVTGELGGRDWNGKVYGENVARTIEVIGGEETKAPDVAPAGDDGDLPF